MKPFSTIAKRVLVAGSLVLVTACGSNGITDPTAAKKSGYITVSAEAAKAAAPVNAAVVRIATPAVKTPVVSVPSTTSTLGYNVPAN